MLCTLVIATIAMRAADMGVATYSVIFSAVAALSALHSFTNFFKKADQAARYAAYLFVLTWETPKLANNEWLVIFPLSASALWTIHEKHWSIALLVDMTAAIGMHCYMTVLYSRANLNDDARDIGPAHRAAGVAHLRHPDVALAAHRMRA